MSQIQLQLHVAVFPTRAWAVTAAVVACALLPTMLQPYISIIHAATVVGQSMVLHTQMLFCSLLAVKYIHMYVGPIHTGILAVAM